MKSRPGVWSRAGLLVALMLVVGPLGGPAWTGGGPIELITRGASPSDTVGGFEHAISADGRYVVFSSPATNVVPGQVDAGATLDVFLHDRVAVATILVSRTATSAVTAGNGDSFSPAISADGRFVAFASVATDLVPGVAAANGAFAGDVFLYDRLMETTTPVSRSAVSVGRMGNGASGSPVISADGAFVAFVSAATDLVPGQVDANDAPDVFLYDRTLQTTVLVSRTAGSAVVTGDAGSDAPVLSADGAVVAFVSRATNLVGGQLDTGSGADVFLFVRDAGPPFLVSRISGSAATTGNGESRAPSLNADGTLVAFVSGATNLVAGQLDTNGASDVFLFERDAGTTVLVSRTAASPVTAGNAASDSPALSADGVFVAFASLATDLVPGQVDANGQSDVFLHSRATETTTLVSRTALSPVVTGSAFSDSPVISADGGFVAFRSGAFDLVPGQVDPLLLTADLFRYGRLTGATTLVSRTVGSATTVANGQSSTASLSADGRLIAFRSLASDQVEGAVDLNGSVDIFVHDADNGRTEVVSRRHVALPSESAAGDSFLGPNSVSGDGRFVVFQSRAANLIAGQVDINHETDVFLGDRAAGTLALVSRAADSAVTAGNGGSQSPVLSADGRFVAFTSLATDLVPAQGDSNFASDVFLYDRVAAGMTLVSRQEGSGTTTAGGWSGSPSISADGRYIAFRSVATDLVSGQTDLNGVADIFLYDQLSGDMRLVSGALASTLATANSDSNVPVISADGRWVAFVSLATDLVPAADINGDTDVFLYDQTSATLSLVSRTPAAILTAGNDRTMSVALSADGRFVVLTSLATDLVSGQLDGNGAADVFLYDRSTESTTLVSRTADSPVIAGNGLSSFAAISADGRYVAFSSLATDLVSDQLDLNGGFDTFLYDRGTGTATLVSRTATSTTTTANGISLAAAISADGRFVAFLSNATDLVEGLAPIDRISGEGAIDVFLYDRVTETTSLVSRSLRGHAGTRAVIPGDGASDRPTLNADGRVIAFSGWASNLALESDRNGVRDVFVAVGRCAAAARHGLPAESCPAASSGAGR